MTEFLFFRHGETDWNVQRIFQGHTDIALNETGLKQARLLAEKIRHWKPDVILSSDLIRALHTAEFSQKAWQVPLIKSVELREMNLGDAEGLHRDDVMKLAGPDNWARWQSYAEADESFGFPNGETKTQARLRVLNFLKKFAQENPQYKKIAVSTHGGVLKRVTHGLQGVPEGGVAIPNCVTYRLNLDATGWKYVTVRERVSALVTAEDQILSFFGVDPHNQKEYFFLPGGMIEENESIYGCAQRETLEETGFEVTPREQAEVLVSEYDFHWDNSVYWCRTHFVRADLKTDFNSPRPVQDKAYNKGVRWVPLKKFAEHFQYNDAIVESIRKMIG